MNKEYILGTLRDKGVFYSTITIHDKEEYNLYLIKLLRLKNELKDYETKITEVRHKNIIKSIILEIKEM